VVKGPAKGMRLPRCCAVCGGASDVSVQQTMKVMRGGLATERRVKFEMCLCDDHRYGGVKAFAQLIHDCNL